MSRDRGRSRSGAGHRWAITAMAICLVALLLVQLGSNRIVDALARLGWTFAWTCGAWGLLVLLDGYSLQVGMRVAGHLPARLRLHRANLLGHALPAGVGEISKYLLLVDGPATRAPVVAALVMSNLLMATIHLLQLCVLLPVVITTMAPPAALRTTLWVVVAASGLAALTLLALATVGVGRSVFRAAARMGCGRRRVARAARFWRGVQRATRRSSPWSRGMLPVWLSLTAGRMMGLVETTVLFAALGHGQPLAAACLATCVEQLVTWATWFVPMQLGTSEGGAYAAFSAIGGAPAVALQVALAKRVRRLLYLALATCLLPLRSGERTEQSEALVESPPLIRPHPRPE